MRTSDLGPRQLAAPRRRRDVRQRPEGDVGEVDPPDDQNRIPLACRCLLVRDDDRTILFETGIGAFFEPALRERYGVVESHHVLLESLADDRRHA